LDVRKGNTMMLYCLYKYFPLGSEVMSGGKMQTAKRIAIWGYNNERV